MMVKQGTAFLLFVTSSLLCALSPARAQQSEHYRLQASVCAQSHGEGASQRYRNQGSSTGQPVSGSTLALLAGVDVGFINGQLFDHSPPTLPVVRDGTGEDLDRTTDDSRLCATWTTEDPDSGIFGGWLSIGSAPGAADIFPATLTDADGGACVDGPFARCVTYYVALESRNGAGLRSAPGGSDGIFVDDPVDVDDDGLGNDCDLDDDDDGLLDLDDDCPCDPTNDADGDGHCDNHPLCEPDDNCPGVSNPGQADADGNGTGDACEEVCRLHVDIEAGPGIDCTTIQECVTLAPAGCVVLVRPGIYAENLVIDRAIGIEGVAGAEQTVLNSGGVGPVIHVDTAGQPVPVKLTGLTIQYAWEGVRAGAATEIIDSRFLGTGTALRVVQGGTAGTPHVELLRTSIEGGTAGVSIETGSVRLRESTIAGCIVGAQLEGGALSLERSWVRDSTTAGIQASGGHVRVSSSLVTDSGLACVKFDESATARIEFATISGCDVGIDLQNQAPAALEVSESIVHGNGNADLSGVSCAQVHRSATAASCCGQNGNLCADPLFVDAAAGEYGLTAGSPCIDSTFGAEWPGEWPCSDHDGRPRLLDGDRDGAVFADMGALEFDPIYLPAPGDIQAVLFTDGETLGWQYDPDSVSYDVLATPLSEVDYHSSWSCVFATEELFYPLPPFSIPPGTGFAYVVVGRDAGGQTGSLGDGSCAERSSDVVCP